MWVKPTPSTGKIRYVETYVDHLTGKKKEVSCTFEKDTAKNRKEAARILQEKIRSKQDPEEKELTLQELIQEYRADLALTAKESTLRRNGFALAACMDLLGADTIVSRLTPRNIKSSFLRSGKSPVTLNGYLKRLKGVILWGYRNDLISSMCGIDKMDRFPVPEEKWDETLKYMERDELVRLLSEVDQEEHKLLIKFLALSGMRCGEAIALHRSDIDLQKKVIHVSKTWDANNKLETAAKTAASTATVFIQPELENVIHEINAYYLQKRLRHGIRTDLFMFSRKGEHLQYYTFNKYFKENTERVLGRALTTHSLRHTHASLLFEAGFTVPEVSARLRHADSRVTQEIYIHVTKRLQEKYNEHLRNTSIL
ncbi:MAG: site-specific integrase [Lachnospiraceae bacterium]|nr:site-specific integrase [Lachnospiraceae bacterium]